MIVASAWTRGARPVAPAWLRLVGPAFAVSIGYVDPGNWASDLAAGKYAYALLWSVVLASVVALVLQAAVARVTIALRTDLASAIAARWPRYRVFLWGAYQISAMATDVAEFAGIALGAHLLFNFDAIASVCIGLAVLATLFALDRRTANALGSAMIAVVAALAIVFAGLIGSLHPDWAAAVRGSFVPALPNGGALLIVVAIFGATVMPHNLFLHSSLVHERCKNLAEGERGPAAGFFTSETVGALGIATLVNVAIVIVGASLAHGGGSIEGTFAALGPAAGAIPALLFGAALIASSIAATTTATLSGDYIFAAFSPVRFSPALRRTATVLPAAALLVAHVDVTGLLLWSQTALCVLLPFAVIPLLVLAHRHLSRRAHAACVGAGAICIVLDVALLVQGALGAGG
jgi:manganese transport protein